MKSGLLLSIVSATLLLQSPAPAADALSVTITVDASRSMGELPPVWRFFGADEPNYATMKDGRKLLVMASSTAQVPLDLPRGERMGSPRSPNASQYAQLEKASELVPEPLQPVATRRRDRSFDITLPRQGVALIELQAERARH